MTKQDLIQEIARSTGYVQAEIRSVVEGFLEVVAEGLVSGSSIEIRGFGTFSIKNRKPRPARNPRTGEPVQLGVRAVPVFKFSSDVKTRLNQSELLGVPARESLIRSKV
ncbi:MAG TPA: HU family DNA-binding protein [Fibrobacteraceae bacterium]|nr:HU family DNA-binding protein [Fibrobacteraceae bacterium]